MTAPDAPLAAGLYPGFGCAQVNPRHQTGVKRPEWLDLMARNETEGPVQERITTQALALIICSACLREVSVSFAPLSMRATSSVRSSPVTGRMLVRVRPPDSFFSMT